MEENINSKLKSILSKVGTDKLKNSADMVSEFLSTPDGRRLKNSLTEHDKQAILEKFLKMDPKKASEALENTNVSGIKGMSYDEIVRRLKREE